MLLFQKSYYPAVFTKKIFEMDQKTGYSIHFFLKKLRRGEYLLKKENGLVINNCC